MKFVLRAVSVLTLVVSTTLLGSAAQPAKPLPPKSIRVQAATTAFNISWSRVPRVNAYEITDGVTTRKVAARPTHYAWGAPAGQYECFRVRSVRGKASSAWVPANTYACATMAGMSFPWPKGTSLNIGPYALHGDNVGALTDDRNPQLSFTFSNPLDLTALDIVLDPVDSSPGQSSQVVTAVAVGKVLAVSQGCRTVLIDHSFGPDGPLWVMYTHVWDATVKAGDNLNRGDPLGPVRNDNPPSSTCKGLYSDAFHVHLALIHPDSATTGTFVTLKGKAFCRTNVVGTLPNSGQVVLSNLTTTAQQPFTVPC
jgi:hypothetical protein